jgi:hypothetical protein
MEWLHLRIIHCNTVPLQGPPVPQTLVLLETVKLKQLPGPIKLQVQE